ncbi:MAG: MFS transporter [Firmicutes bacterium]|nr:MFS transporter [Bacillota bacterium]
MKIAETPKPRSIIDYPKLCIIAMSYIAVGLSLQGFIAMLTLVREEFAIGSAQAGLYSTFFFLSSSGIAIFSGRLVDRLGSKRGLVLGAFLVGLLMVLHSLAPVFGMLLVLAFLSGFCFSLITPSVNKGVMELAPPDKRALCIGIGQSGNALGGVLGAGLLPWLGMLYGWRTAILIAGCIAIIFSFLLQTFYKPVQAQGTTGGMNKGNFIEDMKVLLGNKALLCIAMLGFMFGFSIGSITTHLVIFLDQDIGFTPALAGVALAVLQVGGVFGQPGWGYINDTYFGGNRRLGFLIVGLMAGGFTILLGSLIPGGIISGFGIYVMVFFYGITSLGIPGLYFATVGEIVPEKLLGTATGMALLFIRGGVIVGPPLVGLIADIQGNYTASWLILGGMLLGVTVLFYGLSAKYMQTNKKTASM